MAIYSCSIKSISRSNKGGGGGGRSIIASVAYADGEKLTNLWTGEVYDYTRKQGVESSAIYLPDDAPKWAMERETLWNAVEKAEKRKNSCLGRQIIVAIPHELSKSQRTELVGNMARFIAQRYNVAVDAAIHAPSRQGDERNFHAHILFSSRRIDADGFGEKTRELDDRRTSRKEVQYLREMWAAEANKALERANVQERIDHRSLRDQGIKRMPSVHLGPTATALERRGIKSRRGNLNRAAQEVNKQAAILKQQTKQLDELQEKLKQETNNEQNIQENIAQGINAARNWYRTEKAAREKAVLEQQEREAEEKRQREVKAIMEQIDREQAARIFWKATSPNMTYTERKKSVDIALAKWDTSTPEERRKQENEASWRGIRIQMEKRKQDLEREQERKLQRSHGRGGGWGL